MGFHWVLIFFYGCDYLRKYSGIINNNNNPRMANRAGSLILGQYSLFAEAELAAHVAVK